MEKPGNLPNVRAGPSSVQLCVTMLHLQLAIFAISFSQFAPPWEAEI